MRPEKNRPFYAMSRRRKTGFIMLCLMALLLLVWFDHSPLRHSWRPAPESQEQTKVYDYEKYHAKTFAVINVIDGDTIDIDIPDAQYEYTRIRLLGIDAPETKGEQVDVMYFGPQAAEFTSKLALGKSVTVYLDVPNPTRGKYGRLLAYIKLPDGKFLNEALLAEGYVFADSRFSHSFYNKYRQLQSGARGRKKGLWQNVTPDQLPEWMQ